MCNHEQCSHEKTGFGKGIMYGAIVFIGFLITDFIQHYSEYVDLQNCKQTSHEPCKLIAVPASLNTVSYGN